MLRQDRRTIWPESGIAVGRPVAVPTRTSRRSAPRIRLSNESTSRLRPGGRQPATSLLGEAARLARSLSWSALVGGPGMRRIIAAVPHFPALDVAVSSRPGVSSSRERRHLRSACSLRAQALRPPPPYPLLVLAPRARPAGARFVLRAGRCVLPG